MLGVLANVGGIALGVAVGLLFKKLLKEHSNVVVMQALGISVLGIGIMDLLKVENALILILALSIGGFIGATLQIEKRIEAFGDFLQSKIGGEETEGNSVGKGFVSATLVFCIGAMVVYGSIQAGLGNNNTLYIKTVLDMTVAMLLTATYGWGVILSAIPVGVIQGVIALFAGVLEPIATPEFMNQLSGIGGALVMCIGINLLEIKKIHTADMLPAILGAFAVFLL